MHGTNKNWLTAWSGGGRARSGDARPNAGLHISKRARAGARLQVATPASNDPAGGLVLELPLTRSHRGLRRRPPGTHCNWRSRVRPHYLRDRSQRRADLRPSALPGLGRGIAEDAGDRIAILVHNGRGMVVSRMRHHTKESRPDQTSPYMRFKPIPWP